LLKAVLSLSQGFGRVDLELEVLGGFMGMLMEGMTRIDDASPEE